MEQYIQEVNDNMMLQLYNEDLRNKYRGTLQRLCSIYDLNDDSVYDKLPELITDEYVDMKITSYSDITNTDINEHDIMEEMQDRSEYKKFKLDVIRRDEILSKLYRLSNILAKQQIAFLNCNFNGGSGFCRKSENIFNTYPECKGVVGWYTQFSLSLVTKVDLLCHPTIHNSNNGPNGDAAFIKKFIVKHLPTV